MLCGQHSLVNHGEREGVAIPLRCRAWSCSECGPMRRRQLISLAERGTPERFVTLTVNPRVGGSPAERAHMLARAWRLVMARFKRKNKKATVEYLAVFEATKRGEPHLHILLRSPWISQKWLSAQMAEVLRSPIVDIRRCKDAGTAARYVAKYIGKAPHRFATCKRYWCTRNWAAQDPQQEAAETLIKGGWEIDERPLWIIVEDWRGAGVLAGTPTPAEARYALPDWMSRAPPALRGFDNRA